MGLSRNDKCKCIKASTVVRCGYIKRANNLFPGKVTSNKQCTTESEQKCITTKKTELGNITLEDFQPDYSIVNSISLCHALLAVDKTSYLNTSLQIS